MTPTRAELERLTPEQIKLHEQYVVAHAADHDDDCPCDDTCECSMKARNDAVSAVCRYLAALLTSEGPAPTPARLKVTRFIVVLPDGYGWRGDALMPPSIVRDYPGSLLCFTAEQDANRAMPAPLRRRGATVVPVQVPAEGPETPADTPEDRD